jgi:ABC-type uncharacterized transport system permease subunit
MINRTKWIKNKLRNSKIFLGAGALVGVVGIIAELRLAYLPYNFRIITGLGILLIGIGVAYLVRYAAAQKDEQSARRATAEELDERNISIRQHAGYRAYWLSTGLVYAGLMWSSFAANGSLPPMAGDALWYFLVGTLLVPFAVYIASTLIDQRNA